MCWISNKATPLISDGTVKIFKVCKIIDGNICGFYYQEFKYVLNTEYKQDITMEKLSCCYYGDNGFHSYSTDICHTKKWQQFSYKSHVVLFHYVGIFDNKDKEVDFYCVKEADCNCFDKDYAIIEGYLPKGATYYVNNSGEIISNKIILTKVTHIK